MIIDTQKVKNRVIFVLILVLLVMVTGIIVLAHDYDFKPSHPSPRWQVEFTSIAEGEKKGNASSRYKPYYVGTYASFYVDFITPGDEMVYDIQISNLGNINSRLKDIIYITNPYKDAIKYQIVGLNEGDKLKAGVSKNFKIKVSYEPSSNITYKFDKPISITLNYVQDTTAE